MQLELTVFSHDPGREEQWVGQVRAALDKRLDVAVKPGSNADSVGHVVLVDGTDHANGFLHSRKLIDSLVARFDKKNWLLLLVVDQSITDFPALSLERQVDDVLVFPFRPLEVVSKVQNYEQQVLWGELSRLNASFSEVLEHLQIDLGLAERLQKSQMPKRFEEIKGFEFAHRYWVGARSGGDYFDLAETQDQSSLSFVLSNSSSYGLCNSVLSVLMRVCLKVTVDQLEKAGTTTEVVKRIHQDVLLTLGEAEYFSIFFGVLSRKDWLLRFTFLGEGALFYAAPQQPFQIYPALEQVISRTTGVPEAGEFQIQLHPQGRLVLLSGGAIELLGGVNQMMQLLEEMREKDLKDILNEISFQIKSHLAEDDIPGRDCTAVVMEVSAAVLGMAKLTPDES